MTYPALHSLTGTLVPGAVPTDGAAIFIYALLLACVALVVLGSRSKPGGRGDGE